MSKIVNDLIEQGYLKTDKIIEAFSEIGRIEFVPREMELQSDANVALPIGYGQTISQPLTLAFMLELLAPKSGQKILDLGSGSGWSTALLSYIVGGKGKVIAVERIKELLKIGEKNTDKFGFVKKGIAEFHVAEEVGFPEKAPYDRILVSASVSEIPQNLLNQLEVGGIMVIPIKNSIIFIEKKNDLEFSREEFPGFSFVPLIF
jgi:protein-L-isoaspartate(D-aspartate) O-methyltransferase